MVGSHGDTAPPPSRPPMEAALWSAGPQGRQAQAGWLLSAAEAAAGRAGGCWPHAPRQGSEKPDPEAGCGRHISVYWVFFVHE